MWSRALCLGRGLRQPRRSIYETSGDVRDHPPNALPTTSIRTSHLTLAISTTTHTGTTVQIIEYSSGMSIDRYMY
mgnify:CR=1 FL=1